MRHPSLIAEHRFWVRRRHRQRAGLERRTGM